MSAFNNGVHVFNDDKFIDTAIFIFENFNSKSYKYFVIAPNSEHKFLYVKSSLAQPVKMESKDDFQNFVKQIVDSGCDVVYLHALDFRKRKLLKLLPNHIVVVWLIWGYDLYTAWPVLQNRLYLKRTKRFLNQGKNIIKLFKDQIKKSYLAYKVFLKLDNSNHKFGRTYRILSNVYKDYYEDVKRVNVVVPIVESEMSIIKKMKISPAYAPFKYVFLEQLLHDNISLDGGVNILVGNSADPTNNHVDAFIKLSKLKLGSVKIYVPLSYGGSNDYKKFVIDEGYKILGDNFHPLNTFLPLDEYSNIIASCGTVIFNHLRQQGVGNIVALGYLGAQIFLNKKNLVYSDFVNKGMYISTIDQLSQKTLQYGLRKDQKERNKNILDKEYSFEQVMKKMETMAQVVKKEKKLSK